MLHVRRPRNPSLVCENQGTVWNYAAGSAGSLEGRVMFQEGGQSGRISLLDCWVNPTNLTVDRYAMYTISVRGDGTTTLPGTKLAPGQ